MPIGEVISYRDAMKLFNEETFGKSLWGIPRKGYAGYNAVQHIRKGDPHKNFSTIAELKQQEEPISVPTKKQQEKAKAKAEEEEKAKKKAEEEAKAKADAKAKKDKRKLKKLEKEKAQLEQVVTELQQVIVEEAPQIALQVAEIVDKVEPKAEPKVESFGSTVSEQVENILKALLDPYLGGSVERKKQAVRKALEILRYKENQIIQEARKPLQAKLIKALNDIKNKPKTVKYGIFGHSPATGRPESIPIDNTEIAEEIPVFEKSVVDLVEEEVKAEKKQQEKSLKKMQEENDKQREEQDKKDKEYASTVDTQALKDKWGTGKDKKIPSDNLFFTMAERGIRDSFSYDKNKGDLPPYKDFFATFGNTFFAKYDDYLQNFYEGEKKLKKLEKEKAEIVDKVDIPVIELSTTIPDNTFFKNVMDGQTEKNILSDKNIEMPTASLTPSPRPTESDLKTTVVDNVEQMSSTPAPETMPEFAPESTWIPKDYEFYEQLKANLKLKKRDYRVRPFPVSQYPMYLAKIEELSKQSLDLDKVVNDAHTKMYKEKAGTPEYVSASDAYRAVRQEQINKERDLSLYRRKKVAMETWSSKNQIIYEFSYDGYNPQKIIDQLPDGKISKQLAWIINERSNMMKEVNKSRGNPIRTVTFDLVLNDKDNVFVQCSWDIKREAENIQGYYSENVFSHFLEEYKLSDDTEVPSKFQSEETISRLKAKEQQEKEKAEAKVNTGYGNAEINGHRITYKGRTKTGEYKSGKYVDLYVTNDAKKINDTTIVEEVKTERGKRQDWKNDAVKDKIYYEGGVIIKVNRIDAVEKKFYYNIIGYALQSGYNSPKEFLPYQDTKEREARTTTKQGSVTIPFDKLDISWKVPAIEKKEVEVITRPEGDDGRHHFQKDGFNASASNDTKASMKNAIYDDFVYIHIYKHNMGKEDPKHDPIITGFHKEDYEMMSKPRKVMVDDWRTGKPVEQIQEDRFNMVVKWNDKKTGLGEVVGYFVDKYDDSGNKPKPKVMKTPKKYYVQFPFKKSKNKFDGYEAMRVDAFDMSGLMEEKEDQ